MHRCLRLARQECIRRQSAYSSLCPDLTSDATIYAFTRGWIIIEGGHSICLTGAGRLLNMATRAEN